MINVLEFINSFIPLINFHSNDFITENLWESFVPLALRKELDDLKSPDLILHRFIQNRLSLPKCSYETQISTSTDGLDWTHFVDSNSKISRKKTPNWECVNQSLNKFIEICSHLSNIEEFTDARDKHDGISLFNYAMSDKKSYEVMKLTSLIVDVCEKQNINTVVDIGSGKGYLGSDLTFIKGLNVIELDSRESNSKGAKVRREQYKKQIPSIQQKNNLDKVVREGSYNSIVRLITATDTITKILDDEGIHSSNNLLTGLHCCGGLSSTIINNFVTEHQSKSMVIIGCCYHLLQEEHVKNFSRDNYDHFDFPLSRNLKRSGILLGRNGRLVASQSVSRLIAANGLCDSMYHRIVLQNLLKHKLGYVSDDWMVGNVTKKMANRADFVEYVRLASRKLGFGDIVDNMTSDDIKLYDLDRNLVVHRFTCLFYLKCCLSAIIENIITWDRLQFLKENGIVNAQVLELFDEIKSPRRFAIVAYK